MSESRELRERIRAHIWSATHHDDPHWTYKNAFEIVRLMPRIYIATFATSAAVSDVNNGGFLQYLDNETSFGAADAYAAFLEMGAPQHARILLEAMAYCMKSDPSLVKFELTSEIEAAIASLSQVRDLDELDRQFYRIEGEDWQVLLDAYLLQHKAMVL